MNCRSSTAFHKSIQPLLSLGPGLPSAMHPQPLVGITPHVVLNNLREQRGVRDYVGFSIFDANQLHGRIETKTIFLQLWVPNRESRHDGRVSFQSHPGDAAGSAREYAEEIHEHALAGDHVG